MNPGNSRYVPPRASPPKKSKPILRTHRRAILLIACYVAVILTPWIVTAKLSFHPLTLTSWTYTPGISYKDYQSIQAWAKAVPILNAVAAVLAIPIISSVIAQATVVFAQRRHPGQQLSVRQLFRFADRSWMNVGTLHKMLWWDEPGHARVNWYIIACTGLVVLAVHFPLYLFLAPWNEITMATCEDTSYMRHAFGKRTCDFNYKFKELGYTQFGIDLEPAQMAVIPAQYILPQIRNDLTTLNEDQAQPHIWKESLSYGDTTIGFEGLHCFVAALPGGVTTGVLQEHIMRLNSTASCISLEMSEFPPTCSGENPFQASFEYRGVYEWGQSDVNISTVDICAPGNLGKYPWTVSRNRQGLSEEMFLKFISGKGYDAGVLQCTGLTTRGYFELGNVHSENNFGPLLEKWPSSGASPDEYQFHDYMGRDWSAPSGEDTARGGARPVSDTRTWRDDPHTPESYTNMSGPLMTPVLALFGPGSWLDGLANLTSTHDKDRDTLDTLNADQLALLSALCDAVPFRHFTFSLLSDTYGHESCGTSMLRLMITYSDHMSRWSRNTTAEARLSVAMFLANQAALTSHTAVYCPGCATRGARSTPRWVLG
ncbi:hypothetical protein E8E11_009455 [Didymella keratinophila]|nr:hypothetical protein E8E11_009455 [Didymella keratinophila]